MPKIGVCRACHGSVCAVPAADRDVPCLPRIGMCRACRGSECAMPAADRDVPCLPRIGMCRACRGSGCAVPAADRGVPCLPRIGVCRARGTLHHGSRVGKNRTDPALLKTIIISNYKPRFKDRIEFCCRTMIQAFFFIARSPGDGKKRQKKKQKQKQK